MAYAPNNNAIFQAAFAGAMAGMAASNRVAGTLTNYAAVASVAGAFAQEVDTLWGVNPSTTAQETVMAQICEATWQSRAPNATGGLTTPATFATLASALILAVNAAQNYLVAQGIPYDIPSEVGQYYQQVLLGQRPNINFEYFYNVAADDPGNNWVNFDLRGTNIVHPAGAYGIQNTDRTVIFAPNSQTITLPAGGTATVPIGHRIRIVTLGTATTISAGAGAFLDGTTSKIVDQANVVVDVEWCDGGWSYARHPVSGVVGNGSTIRVNGGSPYQLTKEDVYVPVDTNGGVVTVILPVNAALPNGFTVKVADIGGNAAIANITVDGGAGGFVDGALTKTLNLAFDGAEFTNRGGVWTAHRLTVL